MKFYGEVPSSKRNKSLNFGGESGLSRGLNSPSAYNVMTIF